MAKTKIDHRKFKTLPDQPRDRRGNPIPLTLYCFYPDGVWDEDKLTKQEAEAKYPRNKFQWNLVKD